MYSKLIYSICIVIASLLLCSENKIEYNDQLVDIKEKYDEISYILISNITKGELDAIDKLIDAYRSAIKDINGLKSENVIAKLRQAFLEYYKQSITKLVEINEEIKSFSNLDKKILYLSKKFEVLNKLEKKLQKKQIDIAEKSDFQLE